MKSIFFDGWFPLFRTAIVAVVAYAALVIVLRVSGKRTLSKMNAFDLVVTVALGSTLATILLSPTVALAEGVLAFAMLVGLQYVVTWSSVRSAVAQNMAKSTPTLLFYRGRFLDNALLDQRVTREEVLAAVRGAGLPSLDRLAAVVLETDGTISIVPQDENNSSVLSSVVNRAPNT